MTPAENRIRTAMLRAVPEPPRQGDGYFSHLPDGERTHQMQLAAQRRRRRKDARRKRELA